MSRARRGPVTDFGRYVAFRELFRWFAKAGSVAGGVTCQRGEGGAEGVVVAPTQCRYYQ